MEKINMEITNCKLEKFSLNFSRSANCDVAPKLNIFLVTN